MENGDFYESTAAAELATAYEKQTENQDIELLLLFVLLFSANTL